MKKEIHFKKSFINILYSVIFSTIAFFLSAVLLTYTLHIPVMASIGHFIVSNLLFILFFSKQFVSDGYNDGERNQISFARLAIGLLPCWIIYAIYELLSVYILKPYIPGTGIVSFTMVIANRGNESVIGFETLPENFLGLWFISFLIHIICFTVFACVSYKIGLQKREKDKNELLSGVENNVFMKKALVFIPIANIYILIKWIFGYVLMPERKFKRCFLYLLLFFGIWFASESLRMLFYKICQVEILNLIVAIILHYIFTLCAALLAYLDATKFLQKAKKTSNDAKI